MSHFSKRRAIRQNWQATYDVASVVLLAQFIVGTLVMGFICAYAGAILRGATPNHTDHVAIAACFWIALAMVPTLLVNVSVMAWANVKRA